MRVIREWLDRLLGTMRLRRRDGDLEQELQVHIELAVEDARRRGLGVEEALRATRLRIGGSAQAMDSLREQRGLPWLDDVTRDARHGVRMLRRNPGFTAVALLTLTLGVGGNTAIFSIVNGVILRPLDYPDSHQLMYLNTRLAAYPDLEMSPPEYFEFREMNQSFADVGAFTTGEVNLTAGGRPQRVRSALVDEHLLNVLRIQPWQGRLFAAGETNAIGSPAPFARGPQPPPIAVLSHELWQTAFGGQPIVGHAIDVDGRRHEVIGIMPPGTDVMDRRVGIWLPLGLNPANRLNRGAHYLHIIGRLKNGITVQSVRTELQTLVERWSERSAIKPGVGAAGHVFTPMLNGGGHSLQMKPLREHVLGNASQAIWALQAAVGLVLLIACANVASLQLARAETRRRELVVRRALGASRARLLRQLVTEGVLVLVAGAALGVWLARVGLEALVRAYPTSLPRTNDVEVDGVVLLFTLGTTLVTGALVGLAPNLQLRLEHVIGALHGSGGAGATVPARHHIRRALIVCEIALAVVLVVGAGLLVRTVYNLTRVDAGFDGSGLVTFSVTVPTSTYPLPSSRAQLYGRLLDTLRAAPGVEAATAMSGLPPNFPGIGASTDIDGYSPAPQGPSEVVDFYQYVMSGYFNTMGIPIVAGRGFSPTDATSSGLVAVVNETFVRTFSSGQNPIGRRLRRCGRCDDGDPWFTIIGVAKDVKQRGLDRDAGTEVYVFLEQAAVRRAIDLAPTAINVVLRTPLPAAALAETIASAVREMDRGVPVVRLRDLDAVLAESISRPRLLAELGGTFATMALILAAIGTYGVLAYMVTERRREIGIRLALGARRSRVLTEILAHGLALTAIGVSVGAAGAFGLNRLIASLLFGVDPTDAATLAIVIATIAVVAALASWLPAWRASRLDLNAVLRTE